MTRAPLHSLLATPPPRLRALFAATLVFSCASDEAGDVVSDASDNDAAAFGGGGPATVGESDVSADDDTAPAPNDENDAAPDRTSEVASPLPMAPATASSDAGGTADVPSAEFGFCPAASDRIDPNQLALTDASFEALGLARTGVRATPTAHRNARVRYVSAARGSDGNDGSSDAPWQSLQHAADTVSAGTTVLVDASGPYAPFEIYGGGEPGAYVIFTNQDAGALPLVEGATDTTALIRISASYVVVQGFEIAHHPGASLDDDTLGIEIEPDGSDLSFIEVRGNVIHDIGPSGLDDEACYYNGHGIIAHAEGSQISNLIISGNELHDLYVGHSEVLVVNGNVADFCVSSNFIHDVNNIAIDIIGYEQNDAETARRGKVIDNVVLDASNYWPYCSRGNCAYPPGDESSDGIYVDGGADLEIAYNIVGRTDHGIELQSENGELIRDVEVHHNLVFNSNYADLTLGEVENSREFDNVLVSDPSLASEELESCK